MKQFYFYIFFDINESNFAIIEQRSRASQSKVRFVFKYGAKFMIYIILLYSMQWKRVYLSII